MALYLQELALLETTTNTVVKLTNVMEGVEGSGVFNYTVEDVPVRINAGQTLNYKQRHTLDIRVVDDAVPATQAILTEWANAPENYRFKAAGYGGGDFLLWDEPVQLTFPRQRDGVATRRMLMTLDAVPGFAGASGMQKLPVYAGPNLLGIYNVLAGSATELNGAVSNLNGLNVQSNGLQTVVNAVGIAQVSWSLFFPFAQTLTFSVNFTANVNKGAFAIEQTTITGVQVGASANVNFASTGRASTSLTLLEGATIRLISFGVRNQGATVADQFTFNTPAIRLGGETTWTP